MSTQKSKGPVATIEMLNTVTLSVAVVFFLSAGTVSYVLGTYLWPQVIHTVRELDPERLWMPAIRTCMGSGVIQSGLFFAAALLIGKEFFVRRKAISLIINGLAGVTCLAYSVFYILLSISILAAPTFYLVSIK